MTAPSFERAGTAYASHYGHIAEGVAIHRDGTVAAVLEVEGFPYDLAGNRALNGRHALRAELLRTIADEDVSVYEHLVQHDGVPPFPAASGHRTPYGRELAADYERHCLSGMRQLTWLITIMVAPGRGASGWRGWLGMPAGEAGEERARQPGPARDRRVRRLEDRVRACTKALEPYRPRRLGVRVEGGIAFDEMAEAHAHVLYGRWRPIPLVEGGLMGASIYAQRVITSNGGFRIEAPGVPDEEKPHGTMLGFRVYPKAWRVGMFDGLIGLPFRFVLTNSYAFHGRTKAGDRMADRQRHMQNAGDRAAESLSEELDDAIQAIERGEHVMGTHLWSLAVHADRFADLAGNAADAASVVVNAGAVPVAEDIGMEGAFWAQLPGSPAYLQARAGGLPSIAFAAMSSLHAHARGDRKHHWKRPVYRARTVANTAYDVPWHVEDVGHQARFGPTGSGKTLHMAFEAVMLDPLVANRGGCQIVFDKDGGNRAVTLAMGGPVATLRMGDERGSGAAPLLALPDDDASRAWLHEFISGLIMDDGRGALTPLDDRRLADGIAFAMRLPVGLRAEVGGIAAVRQYMTHADPLGGGARLDRWCRGGALGWAFDGVEDRVSFDAPFSCVDPTAVLEHGAVMPPMAAYLLHRAGLVMDGRPVVLHADEFRSYLPDVRVVNGVTQVRFARGFENVALTGRKLEVSLDIATQQPEHILSHPVGPSLVAQCKTRKLYRNPDARPDMYIDGLGCTPRIHQAVSRDMLVGPRSVVVLREGVAVRCVNDLSAIAHHIPVLSSGSTSLRVLADTVGNEGKEPERWLPVFRRRMKELQAA